MRNVTLALPEEVHRRARVRAAEEDLSLSAWVQRLIVEQTDLESDFERRRRLQDEVLATIQDFSAADRLSRDEVHERRRG